MKNEEWFRSYFSEPYGRIYAEYILPPRMTIEEADLVRKALGLTKSKKILDCPCGFGRHMEKMQARFPNITGLDLDTDCLKRASESVKGARFVRGDMRCLPFPNGQFDAVMNLFNSFGYFSDSENQEVMKEFSRVLKPGGKVIIDVANPEPLVEIIKEYPRTEQQVFDLSLMEDWSYSPKKKILQNRTRIKLGSKTLDRGYTLRLYSYAEYEKMFRAVGLEVAKAFGESDGAIYDEKHSTRLILVGEKRN